MSDILNLIKKLVGMDKGVAEGSKMPVWKKLNTMVLIAAAGVFLILLANISSPGERNTEKPVGSVTPNNSNNNNNQLQMTPLSISALETTMAKNLADILTQIEGAGNVTVTVNLASTTENDYAVNTSVDSKKTLENDQKGGNRTTTETNEQGQMVLVRENQGSQEQPVVVKENKPEVKGVIVVAEGVDNPRIKSDLMMATQVYLDIPLYKVIVLHKGSR